MATRSPTDEVGRTDSAEATRLDSPFPVGQSPLHVKGGIYLGTRKYFDEAVPGGFATLLEVLGPGPLSEFIGQGFLPVGWYDALAIPALVRAEAEATGRTVRAYLRERASFQARHDISGVYRVLLKLASPEAVAVRLPRLTTQIFDFGTVEAKADHGHMIATFTGHPAALFEWYANAFNVYSETALKLAGARTVEIDIPSPVREPPRSGIEMISFSIIARWMR